MAKQNKAIKAQTDEKSRPKVKPTVVEELSDDLAGLSKLPGGPTAVADGGSIEAQAARLGDKRLQSAQRRALAAQIGQVQGNDHLQRVIANLKREQETPDLAPARQRVLDNQPLQGVERSCPLLPRYCPFGGACDICPPQVQATLSSTRGTMGTSGNRTE